MSIDNVTVPINECEFSAIPEEQWQQIMQWNATEMDYSRTLCVHDLIVKQADSTPDALAIEMNNETWSYDQLNRRSNQLAHQLHTMGIRKGTLVGVCLERSPEFIMGLLAILKVGGVYVPMDPEYPSERLDFMLKDANIPVLITNQHTADRLSTSDVKVFILENNTELERQSEENLSSTTKASDLAYVIYTSGSTGQPKGAQITHNNLLNLVYWHQQAFSVTAQDRATQVAGPAFDAAGWEIWPYLTHGASIHIPDTETRVTPELLRDYLLKQQITISFLPTSLAESMMGVQWPATTKLRFILTGADTLRQYPSSSLPFALVNNYGLTEATVVSTSGRIYPTQHADVLPSIGRPIANTQLYILDEQLRPVSIGNVGNLYVGGESVGNGYLNRPELNAERFLADPFSKKASALLYKTGDLARYREDGQIEFLGRGDQQVKIRGYRIELNEIALALNEHPSVNTSFVIAREGTRGDKQLVAYVVTKNPSDVTDAALREGLHERLPEYMIPALFVLLEELPLTPNGKIDQKALPPPDATNTLHVGEADTLLTPIEALLAEHLTTLLNVPHVGRDDNFFMLGGHSLLGTQVIMWVASTFEVTLTLRNLFESPTVMLLAEEIERNILAKVEAMSDEEVQLLLQQGSN